MQVVPEQPQCLAYWQDGFPVPDCRIQGPRDGGTDLLIIVMLFGFACGYAVRSYISPRRRAEERKRFAEVRRLYKISKAQ